MEKISQKVTNITGNINPKSFNPYAMHDREARKNICFKPEYRQDYVEGGIMFSYPVDLLVLVSHKDFGINPAWGLCVFLLCFHYDHTSLIYGAISLQSIFSYKLLQLLSMSSQENK